jgi:Reverse transcriptase (RNA-dependent DNA polymerase)
MSRAYVGIYLGKSPRHARNVGLVLNPATGMVSPQYHLRYDDTFETIRGIREAAHGRWRTKCYFVEPTITEKTERSDTKLNTKPTTVSTTEEVKQQIENNIPQTTGPNEVFAVDDPAFINNVPDRENEGAQVDMPEPIINTPQPIRRSTRSWKPTQRMIESISQEELNFTAEIYYDDDQTFIDQQDPISIMAQLDKDTMYWDEAMKQHDAPQFLEAAIKEVKTHTEMKHWIVIPQSQVPPNTRILDAVWSMKRKRRLLTNEVYKHKARLNIHGGQQQFGINFWDTYSPVIWWATVRLAIILSIIYHWRTRQIDFLLSYPQADVECDLYMKIPRGFTVQGGT